MTWFWSFLFFAIVGMGIEAFFTAVVPLILWALKQFADYAEILSRQSTGWSSRMAMRVSNHIDRRVEISEFKGHVWIGMFVVHGLSALPFALLYSAINNMHILVRAPIYGVCIMFCELISGLVILRGHKLLTGRPYYPWYYSKPKNFLHLIYLPYFKYWCIYGLILEHLYSKLIN